MCARTCSCNGKEEIDKLGVLNGRTDCPLQQKYPFHIDVGILPLTCGILLDYILYTVGGLWYGLEWIWMALPTFQCRLTHSTNQIAVATNRHNEKYLLVWKKRSKVSHYDFIATCRLTSSPEHHAALKSAFLVTHSWNVATEMLMHFEQTITRLTNFHVVSSVELILQTVPALYCY